METHHKKTAMKMPGKPSVVALGNLKLGTLEARLPESEPDSKEKGGKNGQVKI